MAVVLLARDAGVSFDGEGRIPVLEGTQVAAVDKAPDELAGGLIVGLSPWRDFYSWSMFRGE